MDRGILHLYVLFIAGYFLLPASAGHRRVFYTLLIPAALLLCGELWVRLRGDRVAALLLAFAAWMMTTLLWTADFAAWDAVWVLRDTLALLCFVFVSAFVWSRYAGDIDRLGARCVWLAAALALLSIAAWYWNHPFPDARLEPLGVMHNPNQAACAYGVFLVLCAQYLCKGKLCEGISGNDTSRNSGPQSGESRNKESRNIESRDIESRNKKPHTEPAPGPRYLYWLAAVAILALVILTQSRTALAAIGVALLVLLGWRALVIVIPAAALNFAAVASEPGTWSARVEAFSFRPVIWQQVLADMEGYWWFGRGYLLSPKVDTAGHIFDHAHSGYLASLRDGGVVGLGLLAALLGLCLWRTVRASLDQGQRLGLALLLYGMVCISISYDRLLIHPDELWLCFWLPIALVIANRAQPAMLLKTQPGTHPETHSQTQPATQPTTQPTMQTAMQKTTPQATPQKMVSP